jgi:predicted NAD-dependent protein-ADP-ribosyltransferase YbiA (DUF1768 family)
MEPESEADEGPVLFSFESNQNNGFLSPAFLSSFEYGHTEYNCSEQFFQATKATFFIEDNYELYRAIMSATDPEEQKALGKHIKGNHASWHHWGLGSELWKHRIWYRRLINGRRGISSYQGCNASEVSNFRTHTYAST